MAIKPLLWRVFALTLILKSPSLWAAKWSPPTDKKPTFKIGIVGTTLLMDIQDPQGKAVPAIEYRPNSIGRLTLGVSYSGFGASAGLTPAVNPERETQFGKTEGVDYQFRFFREQHSFDFFYQKYTGFYIQNSSEIDPTIQGTDPYLQNSDLHTEHLGFQYFYTFSPDDFSLAACFDQNGWQKESGGTWFGYAAIDQHHIDSKTNLIPDALSVTHATLQDFTGGDFTTGKVGVGGAYALVYNKFYLAGQLIFAGGQQKQNYTLANEVTDRVLPTSGGIVKASLGYNGETFLTSLNLFNDGTTIVIKDRVISMGTMEVSLFLGVHF